MKTATAALVLCLSLAAETADLRYFPLTGRTAVKEGPDRLFNNPALPPGIVADYHGYQLFLIRSVNPQKAAFLLLDYKKMLQAPKYLAHMGGYFGTDAAGRPNYVFAKGVFLAGVIGLDREKADSIARQFAGRIPLK